MAIYQPYSDMYLCDPENFNFYDKPKQPENNNAVEQFLLGLWYSNCPETQFNDKEKKLNDDKLAFYWINKASKQKLPEAQCELGTMYFYGTGVKGNIKKSTNLYIKSLYNLYSQKLNPTTSDIRKENIKEFINEIVLKLILIYQIDCNTNIKHMYNLGYCRCILGDYERGIECYIKADIMKNAAAHCA